MIPDFKTFLKESIWSDMQDRGTGYAVKKEDEVNILDPDRLCKYLNQIYGEFNHRESIKVNEWKESRWLSVDLADTPAGYVLTITYDICPETEEKIIGISYEMVKDWIDFNKLEKRYNSKVEKNEYDNDILTIYPKDDSEVNNELLIDFIDYMLGEIPPGNDKYIYRKNNESIWSDMQERGTGDLERKEDEFDFIGGFKLYERLRKMYKYTNVTSHIIAYYNDTGLITVPLFVDDGMNIFNIDYFVNSGKLSIYTRWYDDARKIFMKLSKKYHIYHPNISIYHIEPFDGDVTNTFFIEVVDFILSCVEPPYKKVIERKDPVSESIWSDMQERGTGDVIKKEDDVNLLDIEEFYDYLDEHYDNKVDHLELNLLTNPNIGVGITQDILLYFKPDRGHILLLSWSRVKIKMPFFDELSDRFDVENPNVMRRIITDKDGNCTNKTFIDVIDFFIEHKDDLLVNESVWSDMQERGTGNMTKREDDIDLLDRYDFFTYLNKIYKTAPPSKIRNYDELNSILVPLFGVNKAPLPPKHLSVEIDYNDGQEITIGKMLMGNFPTIEKDLRNNFNVEDMPAGEIRGEYLKIHPKDGSPVTNSFFITVIDFLLEKAGDKYTIILSKK